MLLYLSEGSLASENTEGIKLCLLRRSLQGKQKSKIKLSSRELGIIVRFIFSFGGGKDKISD
jgi:hypothetical protein